MVARDNEDVEVTAACRNSACEASGYIVYVSGRYNAEGDFETYEEIDAQCASCDEPLEFDEKDE